MQVAAGIDGEVSTYRAGGVRIFSPSCTITYAPIFDEQRCTPRDVPCRETDGVLPQEPSALPLSSTP